jgi:Holliday junction resolvase
MGKKSRDKGGRVERLIVRLLQAYGFAAMKISGMYRPGADLTIPLLGRNLSGEVKARADGFRELYKWLEDRDVLIVKADRKEPLFIVRLSLAAEVAASAGG